MKKYVLPTIVLFSLVALVSLGRPAGDTSNGRGRPGLLDATVQRPQDASSDSLCCQQQLSLRIEAGTEIPERLSLK